MRQLYRDPPPVVVISAVEEAADRAQQSGAIAFLRKPFELDELVAVVVRAIEAPATGADEHPPSRRVRRAARAMRAVIRNPTRGRTA